MNIYYIFIGISILLDIYILYKISKINERICRKCEHEHINAFYCDYIEITIIENIISFKKCKCFISKSNLTLIGILIYILYIINFFGISNLLFYYFFNYIKIEYIFIYNIIVLFILIIIFVKCGF